MSKISLAFNHIITHIMKPVEKKESREIGKKKRLLLYMEGKDSPLRPSLFLKGYCSPIQN
jgi:hypothetical protein